MSATPRLSPRQARALAAMQSGHWVSRETMDRVTGASNSPDVVWKLRRKIGQDAIDMELIDGTDRDGRPCRTGRYRLTEPGRVRAVELLAGISATTDQGRVAA